MEFDRPTIIENPNCLMVDNDPDAAIQNVKPLILENRPYFPASVLDMGSMFLDDTSVVAVMLARPTAGLIVQLTPEGARQFLAAMQKSIDQAEAHNAQQAKAKLDAALQKGQGDGI